MLRVVRLRLEQIQRDFLWGGEGGFGAEDSSCKVGSCLKAFLCLIGPSCVDGAGASWKKRGFFGSKLLVGSLG